MQKNSGFLKTIGVLSGIFLIIIGGMSFIIGKEINIIIKLLIIMSGICTVIFLYVLAKILEALRTFNLCFNEDVKSRMDYQKETMEILEAISVAEIKANKTLKDVADSIVNLSGEKISTKIEDNFEKDENKIEKILVEIRDNLKNINILSENKESKIAEDMSMREVLIPEKLIENSDTINEEPLLEEVVSEKEYETSVKEDIIVAAPKVNEETYELSIENEDGIDEEENGISSEKVLDVQLEEKAEKSEEEEKNNFSGEKIEIQGPADYFIEDVKESSEIQYEKVELEPLFEKNIIEEAKVNENIYNLDLAEEADLNSDISEMEAKKYEETINNNEILQENVEKMEEINVEEEIVENIEEILEAEKEIKSENIQQQMIMGLMAEEAIPKKEIKAVHFADVNLEEIIREELEKLSGEISEEEVLTIVEIKAGNRGIKKLDGIEKLKNLEYLDLWKAEIVDISLLANLKKLSYLRLSKTLVRDLNPLSELKDIEELYLQEIPAVNISPVADLRKLKMLYLEKSKFDSLEPLLLLPELKELYLWGAEIKAETTDTVLKRLESKGCKITK